MTPSHSVINSIAAAGADLTVSDSGYLTVANTVTAAPWINIPFLKISRKNPPVPIGALSATPAVKTVSYTAAASTLYVFDIYANVLVGTTIQNKRFRIKYESDATGADADIATGLTASINSYPDLNVTVSGAATPLTLTGDAGYEVFTAVNISNTTIAANMGTTAIDSATNATPVVVTTDAPHALVVGDTVTISGMTTATALNGQTFRISVINGASSFTLEDSVAAGVEAAGSSAIATNVAQFSRGSYADLSSSAPGQVPPYATQTTPLAGTVSTGSYGKIIFNFVEEDSEANGTVGRNLTYQHVHYYNESDAEYVAYRQKWLDFLNAGVAGTPTTANPALMAAK